jgi:hypothetical protein
MPLPENLRIGTKITVQGQFDGFDRDGNLLVSFRAEERSRNRDNEIEVTIYYPQVSVAPGLFVAEQGSGFGDESGDKRFLNGLPTGTVYKDL